MKGLAPGTVRYSTASALTDTPYPAPCSLASATMLFGLLQERMTSSEHGNPKEKSLLAFW